MKHTVDFYLALALLLGCAAPACAQLPKGDAARGAKVFSAMTCDMCHPGGGNCLNPTKGLKGPDFVKQFPTDDQIAKVIRTGIPGTAMDSFRKDRLSDQQLADIIAYIRSLTPKMSAKQTSKTVKNAPQKNAAAPKRSTSVSTKTQPTTSKTPKAH